MPEMPDVVSGEPVASSWGNDIRDRSAQRYADAADRDAQMPLPVAGDLAWLDSPGELQVYTGTEWAALYWVKADQTLGPGFISLERSGSGMIIARRDTGAPASSGTKLSVQVSDGFLLQIGSADDTTWPETTIMKGRNAGTAQAMFPNGTEALPGIAFLNANGTGLSITGNILQVSEQGMRLVNMSFGAGSPYFRLDPRVTDVRLQGAANFATTATANMAIPDLANGLIRIATSGRKYKRDIKPAPQLKDIELQPVEFYRPDDDRDLVGLVAEDVADQDERLALYDQDGEVNNFSDRGVLAVLAAKVNDLEARVTQLEGASNA